METGTAEYQVIESQTARERKANSSRNKINNYTSKIADHLLFLERFP